MFQIMQQLAVLVMRTSEKPLLGRQRGWFSVSSEFPKEQRMWADTLQGINLASRWWGQVEQRGSIYRWQEERFSSLSHPFLKISFLFEGHKRDSLLFYRLFLTEKKKKSKPGRGWIGIALTLILALFTEFGPPPHAGTASGPLALAFCLA